MYKPDWHALASEASNDPETHVALKNAQFCAAIGFGDERILLEAAAGVVRVAETSKVADFEIRASLSTWEQYSAGRGIETNSIIAMARQGQLSRNERLKSDFRFDGDQRKFWANFHALDLVLQQLRPGRG